MLLLLVCIKVELLVALLTLGFKQPLELRERVGMFCVFNLLGLKLLSVAKRASSIALWCIWVVFGCCLIIMPRQRLYLSSKII